MSGDRHPGQHRSTPRNFEFTAIADARISEAISLVISVSSEHESGPQAAGAAARVQARRTSGEPLGADGYFQRPALE